MTENCDSRDCLDRGNLPDLLKLGFDLKRILSSEGSLNLSTVDVYGRTAHHIAASRGNFECLQLLCKRSEKEELNRADCFGYTPLHYAVQRANTYCAKLLLEAGCNPNVTQHALYTPLHFAALYGYTELVALLCQHGADVRARSSTLETPLIMASRSGIRIRERLKLHFTTLALLLKFGSDINARDQDGMTSLHYVAMKCEDKHCATLMCAAGAKVKCRSHTNLSVLEVARCPDVYRFLDQLQRFPPRLEHLCLLTVRKVLGTKLRKGAEQLSLPTSIEDKLLFRTLVKLV